VKCIEDSKGGVILRITVTPNSKREFFDYNEWSGTLHVRVKEKAVDGKANQAVMRLFSGIFGPCELLSGLKSRKKSILIRNRNAEEAKRVLEGVIAR